MQLYLCEADAAEVCQHLVDRLLAFVIVGFVPVVQMLLKCADIGHLAADTETHKRWAYQLEEEFFQQVGLRHPFAVAC